MDNEHTWQGRHSVRLQDYDYAQAGAYFVTICTQDRQCMFGDVADGEVHLNEYGRIVTDCWYQTPDHFPAIRTDAFIAMPNHFHAIIVIADVGVERVSSVGARHAVPLQSTPPVFERFGKPIPGSLATVIRSLKSAVTKQINELRGTPGAPVWQRGYYEHVIRNKGALNRAREYIANNPLKWELERLNPDDAPAW